MIYDIWFVVWMLMDVYDDLHNHLFFGLINRCHL